MKKEKERERHESRITTQVPGRTNERLKGKQECPKSKTDFALGERREKGERGRKKRHHIT